MLKKFFENSFTCDTFKLFLPKNYFAFLHIIIYMARNNKKIKTDELGINGPN